MKKVFFTGANGFIGSHLIPYLQKRFPEFLIYKYTGKIESYNNFEAEFKQERWDYVFHFAGISHVADCEQDPQSAFAVNTLGTAFLCQLAVKYNFSGVIYFTSTAQVYNPSSDSDGIVYDESSTLKPQNLYATTKLYSEEILRTLSTYSNANVKILRLFNHTHKSQSKKFFLPSVYNQLLQAKEGDTIVVGNLNLERDFSLISDLLNYIGDDLLIRQRHKFIIVNLSSGVARKLNSLVQLLIKRIGKAVTIKSESHLVRSYDPKRVIGLFETSYQSKLSDEEFIDKFLME